MSASLVGSEMCIRDRSKSVPWVTCRVGHTGMAGAPRLPRPESNMLGHKTCLLYTSDAADDM
eukprot:3253750-Alexandrium_andersonii.AAC.1